MGAKVKVVIGGVNGRFGRASARAIVEDDELELAGAFGKPGAAYVGHDVGDLAGILKTGILVSNGFSEILRRVKPDVYLDFSVAEAAVEHAKISLENGITPVVGTSGLAVEDITELQKISAETGTGGMVVPNFSVGAVLMMEFARMAGRFFPNVEIVEMHHTKKLDSPSGTAMHTARKLASTGMTFNAREVEEKELVPGSRGGQGDAGVRVHSLRLPGLISHQEVILGSDGELLTIRHDGLTANCYLKGILMAIKAVAGTKQFSVGLESLLGLTN